MSTTTIRLPDDLKEKVARAAKRAGTTSHNFIFEANAEKASKYENYLQLPRITPSLTPQASVVY